MIDPASINKNTYLAYKSPDSLENNRKLNSDNFDWDFNHPKSLVYLSLQKLSANWNGYPKLEHLSPENRVIFLQLLSVDIPLQVLVANVKSDKFWERFYRSKWSDAPLVSEENRWINIFMSRYYSDYLEKLNPLNYDPEKVTSLVKLCGPMIKKISIRSLVPADIPEERNVSPEMAHLVTTRREVDKNSGRNEILSRDHISLHATLGSLNNLKELHITYQLKGVGIGYRIDQFQFTINDAKNLARGLEKCNVLNTLRLTRSDINCQKIKYIIRGLSDNNILETLDLSHCKIGDEGMGSIAKFVSRHNNLRNLVLVNNMIGPAGVEGLSTVLNHVGCGMRHLDLRLNDRLGSDGIAFIAVALARGCNLISLNISSCNIQPGPLSKAPTGVWSATSAENPPSCGDLLARAIGLVKTPLRFLDISVNNIGSPSDLTLANAICLSYLIEVNLKRSGMSSMAIAIGESAAAAQRLRREAEKGIRFRRSAGRLLQAQRVVKGMNIDVEPLLLAQQLSARPSIVSVTSEDGTFSLLTQPLPAEFGFIPSLKSPLLSSRASSVSGPPSSRRSSHHHITLEPVMEVRRSALVRRGSDGSLLQSRNTNTNRHIKIFVTKNQ